MNFREELLSQQEKLQKYSEIKGDIDDKRKQLIKNNNGFYGGYAQKIKTTFEGAGEKIDAKMMSSRLLKMIGEKKLTTRFSKVAAASVIVMAGGMMMLNPAESEAGEFESEDLSEKPEVEEGTFEGENEKEISEVDQEMQAKLDKSQEKLKEFIGDLGIFSK